MFKSVAELYSRDAPAQRLCSETRVSPSEEAESVVSQVTWVEALPPSEPGASRGLFVERDGTMSGSLEHLIREKRLGRYLCVSSSQHCPRWKTTIHHHQESIRTAHAARGLSDVCHV